MTDFHALYVRHAPSVRRLLLFLCGNPALADDITSETFVRALTAPGPVREETVRAYLFTIARNLLHDSRRRTSRNTAIDQTVPDAGVSLARQAEIRSELDFVLTIVQELAEVDRAALLMRAQEDMPYEEIAHTLGLSLAAVKVKIHRARCKIMQATKTQDQRSDGPEKTP
ncbi:MAG TPA: RNA polymerase sigma factor [Bryobacteraceae bacterium]|nr:RNA polymerase sigma factor [Bryobacteraceae bacterium]